MKIAKAFSRLLSEPEYEVAHYPLENAEKEPIRVQVAYYPHQAFRKFDMHFVLEFGYVCKGRIRRHYPGWKTEIGTGGIWLCGMWEPHGMEILHAPAKLLVLTLYPQLLMNFHCQEMPEYHWMAPFLAPPPLRPKTGNSIRKTLSGIVRKFESNLISNLPEKSLWNRILFMELLLTIRQNWHLPKKLGNGYPGDYAELNPAISLALQSRQFVPEKKAASFCGMSRLRFLESFEHMMGMSFSKFSLRNRLSGAARQLRETNDPIKAIASDWGFADTSHLYRNFHGPYGCTPLEYRMLFS